MNVTRNGKGQGRHVTPCGRTRLSEAKIKRRADRRKKEFLVIIFPGDLPALKVAASPVPAPLDSRRLQPPLPLSASTTPPRPCDVIQ
jgi:hypothetical protein